MIHIKLLKKQSNGFILLLTLLILLIITSFVLSFFFLQTLEVDLIAYETDYLQSYYLANAALEQGVDLLTHVFDSRDQLDPNDFMGKRYQADIDANVLTNLNPNINDPNDYYSCYYTIKQKNILRTVTGIARINNTMRFIERDFEWPEIFFEIEDPLMHEIIKDISELKTILNNPAVAVKDDFRNPTFPYNLGDIVGDVLLRKDDTPTGVPMKQRKYINDIQKDAINDFIDPNGTKDWIEDVRNVKNIDNFNLFYKIDMNQAEYKAIRGSRVGTKLYPATIKLTAQDGYSELDYSESRDDKAMITSNSLIVKKRITLKQGIYFFKELSLEKNAILETEDYVVILTTNCKIGEGAKMIGRHLNDPNSCPECLIIIGETYRVDNVIRPEMIIATNAEVVGHILVPGGKVTINAGIKPIDTTITGSILASELVSQKNYDYPVRQGIRINFTGWPSGSSGLRSVPGSYREVYKEGV